MEVEKLGLNQALQDGAVGVPSGHMPAAPPASPTLADMPAPSVSPLVEWDPGWPRASGLFFLDGVTASVSLFLPLPRRGDLLDH